LSVNGKIRKREPCLSILIPAPFKCANSLSKIKFLLDGTGGKPNCKLRQYSSFERPFTVDISARLAFAPCARYAYVSIVPVFCAPLPTGNSFTS